MYASSFCWHSLTHSPIVLLPFAKTVLFADIAGFTAWSSAREPSQVFILLENLYGAFDKLSHRHGVFKVETIGDCYVAVTGLPLPNKDHAVVMAKFARDCVAKMDVVTSKMEIDLGPDTGDLGIRIGIHSGQVTAGVLRESDPDSNFLGILLMLLLALKAPERVGRFICQV